MPVDCKQPEWLRIGQLVFVELALFTKTLEECMTEFDRLFYIFRNSGGFQKILEWIEETGGANGLPRLARWRRLTRRRNLNTRLTR